MQRINSSPKMTKTGPKTIDCILVGYAYTSSAYHFFLFKLDHQEIYTPLLSLEM